MSILAKHLAFVNEQVIVQGRLADKYKKDERRTALHLASQSRFDELAQALLEADKLLDQSPLQRNQLHAPVLTLRADELDGLPSELIAELSDGAIPDKADVALLQVIEERGGVASLDQIIVGLYRKTSEVMKRNTLTSKLYRMAQKGVVHPVPEKKGVYSTQRLSEEQVAKLFGTDTNEGSQQNLV